MVTNACTSTREIEPLHTNIFHYLDLSLPYTRSLSAFFVQYNQAPRKAKLAALNIALRFKLNQYAPFMFSSPAFLMVFTQPDVKYKEVTLNFYHLKCLCTNLFIYLLIYIFIHLSIFLFIHLLHLHMNRCDCLFVSFIYLYVCIFIHLLVYLYLFISSFIFIYLCIYLFTYLFTHFFIHALIY